MVKNISKYLGVDCFMLNLRNFFLCHKFVPDNCHTRGRFTLYSCRRVLYLVSLREVCRFGLSLQSQRVVNLLQAFFGLVLGNRRLLLKCGVYHHHDFIVVAD